MNKPVFLYLDESRREYPMRYLPPEENPTPNTDRPLESVASIAEYACQIFYLGRSTIVGKDVF